MNNAEGQLQRNLQPGRPILIGNVLDRLQKGTIFFIEMNR